MVKKLIIAIIIVALLVGGGWYYFTQIYSTPIGKIIENGKEYQGKLLTISGEVTEIGNALIYTDYTSGEIKVIKEGMLVGVVGKRYYKLKDKTGEITVITKGVLPGKGAKLRIKGKIDEYAIGSKQLLVFEEQVKPQ